MADFIICTDSSCDLSAEKCKELGVIPFYMTYTIKGEPFKDLMTEESIKVFYQKIREGALPSTSQINASEYIEFWTPLLVEDKPILHISLGSGISGSYNNAVHAVSMMKEDYPNCDIHVVDSTLASLSIGMLVIWAAEMRSAGASVTECENWLNDHKAGVHACFTTGDLKYLHRGGRVSKTSAVVGTMLGINPILHLDLAGCLKVFGKARGQKGTMKFVCDTVRDRVIDPESQTLYISHSDDLERAQLFGAELQRQLGFRDVYYSYIGSTIGSHTGAGLVSIFFCGKDRWMGKD